MLYMNSFLEVARSEFRYGLTKIKEQLKSCKETINQFSYLFKLKNKQWWKNLKENFLELFEF